VAVVLVASVRWFVRANRVSGSYPCVNNLRVISGCKDQWALENSKTPTMPLHGMIFALFADTWANRNWANGGPVCPAGGTYTLGRSVNNQDARSADPIIQYPCPDKNVNFRDDTSPASGQQPGCSITRAKVFGENDRLIYIVSQDFAVPGLDVGENTCKVKSHWGLAWKSCSTLYGAPLLVCWRGNWRAQ